MSICVPDGPGLRHGSFNRSARVKILKDVRIEVQKGIETRCCIQAKTGNDSL